MNETYLCPFDAGRVVFLAGLAVVRLAGRWSGGAYLAVHHRSGRYPFAVLYCGSKPFTVDWVCAMFSYKRLQIVTLMLGIK